MPVSTRDLMFFSPLVYGTFVKPQFHSEEASSPLLRRAGTHSSGNDASSQERPLSRDVRTPAGGVAVGGLLSRQQQRGGVGTSPPLDKTSPNGVIPQKRTPPTGRSPTVSKSPVSAGRSPTYAGKSPMYTGRCPTRQEEGDTGVLGKCTFLFILSLS